MILSSSGGLVYHTRAALNENGWHATRQFVSRSVEDWIETTRASELIVFGPSGAYLLDQSSFSKLLTPQHLIVVEPDRIAKIIFNRRFRHHPITWHARADLLPFQSLKESTFSDFLEQWPKASILFHGVLGQIELHKKQATRGRAKARSLFLHALERRNWMSVHDVASAELSSSLDIDFANRWIATKTAKRTSGNKPSAVENETTAIGTSEPLETSLQNISRDLKENHRADVATWIDHDTQWIGPSKILIPWRLHPRRLHLLGVTHCELRRF